MADVLLVGGENAGEVIDLDRCQHGRIFQVLPKMYLPVSLKAIPSSELTDKAPVILYELHEFHTQDGTRFVGGPKGWSDLQVMDELLRGYIAEDR